MKKIVIFLILCVVASHADGQFRKRGSGTESGDLSYSNPKEYTIADIDITGLKILDKNAVISLTGLRVGDKVKIPGDDISNVIRKLWKHGLVGDVAVHVAKIEEDKVYLSIVLSERPRLTSFSFEGVKKSKETELRKDLDLIRGRILSDAVIRNAEMTVKKHYVNKGFLNAQVKVIQQADTINADGVKLKVVVDSKSKVKVNKIIINGNEEFADSKIKKKFKSTHEKVRFSLFRRAAELIAGTNPRSVKTFVTTTYEVPNSEFKAFINDNIKLNFLKGSKYVKNDYEEDKKKVIEFYNSKGYRDAEILSDTMYAYNDNSINIEINIAEGKKYYFRNITWKGNFVHADKVLDQVLGINKGEVYNKELIDRKLNFNPRGGYDISGLYMDEGYLFFQINPVEVAIEGDSIDIEMRIYEGDQAIINKVIIAGNDRTRDHVIRRELRTIPGQKFSRSNIVQTQQILNQLGYFDPEKTNPTPIPNPADGTVDIEWKLEERSSDQIELSGGWGGAFGFVGTLGLSLNNFSLRSMLQGKFTPIPTGDGQKLSLRAQANGRQYQSYSFSFTEPWLGGRKPNSLSVSFNYSVQRASVGTFDDDGNYQSRAYDDYNASLAVKGITIGLGRRLEWPDSYFTLTNSLSYLVYQLENYGAQGLGFADGNANSITLNATLARNSIDQPTFPTSGSSISLSAAFTPPYSLWRDIDYDNADNAEKYKWIEYHKWMFDAKYYLSVVGKMVLETKAHFGFIGSYSKASGVGPFERFYLGGDGLAGQNFLLGTEVIGMRGYENNTITPPNYGFEGTTVTRDQIDGGIVYNKFTMELRYPVITGQTTIYGFVFAEAGNNWDNFDLFNPFDLYRSAGVGARIFMPAFGLIGINWGYGFDTLPGRSEKSGGQFHFTIGQQLR